MKQEKTYKIAHKFVENMVITKHLTPQGKNYEQNIINGSLFFKKKDNYRTDHRVTTPLHTHTHTHTHTHNLSMSEKRDNLPLHTTDNENVFINWMQGVSQAFI
jgi:hypothetical protein